MSSYVYFYLKKDDTWAMLASYSRNTAQYKAIEHEVPYGELVPLKPRIMSEIFANLSEELQSAKECKERNLKEIDTIAGMPNPVEEKLEAIYQCRSSIEWAEEEIESLSVVRQFYSAMDEIIDTGNWRYKTDDYVWAGIEACPPDDEETE